MRSSEEPGEERKSQAPTRVPASGPGERGSLPSQGDVVGGHRVVRLRGVGGQGAVFEAESARHDRVVALKVPLPDASAESLARFQREIDVLSLLDHPNIPALYESGHDRGRPWFTMRLVDGPTIVQHADATGASPRACVELLLRACSAVAHAHARGVIHRDIKATNVRVDPAGEPQVLDFGIAKTEGLPTLTQDGGGIGTVGESAPEQLLGDPRRVDVRADVWSLGCLLYRMLARRAPLLLPESLSEALACVMREDPRPPSTHATGSDRDLDAICLRALARDPEERYATVLDLARDLQRWLDGEPVEARGPSRWYRLASALRRHRLAFGLGAAAFLVLAAFTVALALQKRQLKEERNLAQLEAAKARAVADAFRSMIEDVDPAVRGTREATAAELLDLVGRRADAATELEPRVKAAVLLAVSRAFTALGNPTRGGWSAGRALEALARAPDATEAERGAVLLALGTAQVRLDPHDPRAEASLREGASLVEGAAGRESADAVAARRMLAEGLLAMSRPAEAESVARACLSSERSRSTVSRELFDTLLLVAAARLAQDDPAEALALADEANAIAASTFHSSDPSRHRPEEIRGRALLELGRPDEALTALDAAITGLVPAWGIEHPATQTALFDAARACAETGRHEEAVRRLQDLLELQRLYAGSHHVATQETRLLLARELEAAGRPGEAAGLLAEGLRVSRALQLAEATRRRVEP